MKIIAIVPTYNRPELIVKNIKCLLAQSLKLDLIIIIDNGSEDDTKLSLVKNGFTNHPNIKYIRLDENIGASGGFATGMDCAIEMGADWVWGMDDDAFPKLDALEKLKSINTGHKFDCLWSNVDEDTDFKGSIKNVDLLIFVGFFISKELIAKVGFPDRRYYMYHDDTDYSNRIRECGYKIIKVRDSVIEHKGYDKRGKAVSYIKTPFGTTPLLNCEPFRTYYIFRNGYHIKIGVRPKIKYLLKTAALTAPKYLLMRPISGLAIVLAIIHIITNKRGKTALPGFFNKKFCE